MYLLVASLQMNILVLHAVIPSSSMDEDCGDISCFPTGSSAMKYRPVGGRHTTHKSFTRSDRGEW